MQRLKMKIYSKGGSGRNEKMERDRKIEVSRWLGYAKECKSAEIQGKTVNRLN